MKTKSELSFSFTYFAYVVCSSVDSCDFTRLRSQENQEFADIIIIRVGLSK